MRQKQHGAAVLTVIILDNSGSSNARLPTITAILPPSLSEVLRLALKLVTCTFHHPTSPEEQAALPSHTEPGPMEENAIGNSTLPTRGSTAEKTLHTKLDNLSSLHQRLASSTLTWLRLVPAHLLAQPATFNQPVAAVGSQLETFNQPVLPISRPLQTQIYRRVAPIHHRPRIPACPLLLPRPQALPR